MDYFCNQLVVCFETSLPSMRRALSPYRESKDPGREGAVAALTSPDSEIHGVHPGLGARPVGSRRDAYAHLSELLLEYVGLVLGTVHPPPEYVVRGAVGVAAPSDVLAVQVVGVTLGGVTEPLQALQGRLTVEGIVRGVILVDHLLGMSACCLGEDGIDTQGLQSMLFACLVVQLQRVVLVGVQGYGAAVAGPHGDERSVGLLRHQGQSTDSDHDCRKCRHHAHHRYTPHRHAGPPSSELRS